MLLYEILAHTRFRLLAISFYPLNFELHKHFNH